MRELIKAEPCLLATVEIMIMRNAKLLARANKRIAYRQRGNRHRDTKRPAITMIIISKALIVFGAFEIRKHRTIIPPRAPFLIGPCIIIKHIAACIKLGVDG